MKESKQSMGWCRLSYELMHDNNLTDKDILLYSIMLDCCDTELTCTIGQKEVTELSCGRISHNMFYACLNRLEKYGYLERDRTGRKNVYKLADIIGLKRQTQKPVIRQSRHAPEEVPAEEQQELKLRYGQFQTVELTMEQFDRLVSDFGETKVLAYIKKCDEYCHEHGKQYPDCDFTIRKWIAEDAHKPESQKAEKDAERERKKERVQKYMELVN
jgi:hypothetical protein